MMDYAFDALLEKAKKKKLIKAIPEAPKLKVDLAREVFNKNPEVINALNEYEMFKLIDSLQKTKESEFRRGVCLRVLYKGEEIAINLEKLREYAETLEKFINFIKLYLTSK